MEVVEKVHQYVTDVFSSYPVLTMYNNCGRQTKTFHCASNRNSIVGINHFGAVASHVASPEFSWNPKNKKAFWLMGKPTKEDRLSLLYLLTKTGVVPKYLTYSYNPEYCPFDLDPYEQGQLTLDSVWYPHSPGTVNYREWAAKHAHQIGDVNLSKNQYHGLVYDLNIYKQHSCEIVTETFFHQPEFLTEKVHRSISLGYPFLILGDHFVSHLRSLGYRTFNDMMHVPNLIGKHQGQLRFSCIQMAGLIAQFCERCNNTKFERQVRENIAHNKRVLAQQVAHSLEQAAQYNPGIAAIIDYKCQLHVGRTPLVC